MVPVVRGWRNLDKKTTVCEEAIVQWIMSHALTSAEAAQPISDLHKVENQGEQDQPAPFKRSISPRFLHHFVN